MRVVRSAGAHAAQTHPPIFHSEQHDWSLLLRLSHGDVFSRRQQRRCCSELEAPPR